MQNRAQDLYWKALVQLRVDCEYMRLRRDGLAWWATAFAIARAVVSGSALTAWIVVKDHPMVWGGVIAAVQMTEGIEKATGLAAHVRGAHSLMNALETLFTDCTMEWEAIYAGQLDEDEITRAWHRMVTQSQEADRKNLPGGLRQRKDSCNWQNARRTPILNGPTGRAPMIKKEPMALLFKRSREGSMFKGGSLPQTSLRVPMPAGAKPPREANSAAPAKHGGGDTAARVHHSPNTGKRA